MPSVGERSRERILEAGLKLWLADGAAAVQARRVALLAGMTHANVLYHFRTVASLRAALAVFAVERGEARLIVQLIAEKNPAVAGLSEFDRSYYWKLCAAG